MSRRRSILFIYNEASFSLEEDGAQARVATMLDRAYREFDRIVVYSYYNHHRYPWNDNNIKAFSQRWPKVKLVLDNYSLLLRLSAAAKNLFISMFPNHASAFIRQSVPFVAPAYRSIDHSDTVYIVNHKFGLTQLNGVDPTRCFVDTHDLLWLKAARLGNRPTTSLGIMRKLRGEVAALNTVSGVLSISPVEAAFFSMALSDVKNFYVPIWDNFYEPAKLAMGPFDFDLVFVASDYVMNVRGFCQMLQTHGHWLAKYRIAVCGNICNHPDIVAAALKHENVEILGFVDDLERVYLRCKAALAPVEGTGLKIKIVSALKSGLPVFVAKQATEGLPPGYEKSVFPIEQGVMESIIGDDAALRNAKLAAVDYHGSFIDAGESKHVVNAIKALMRGS